MFYTRSHSSILHFSVLYIFLFLFSAFLSFFPHDKPRIGCDELGWFIVISYSYGFMELVLLEFVSPDIITSVPLSDTQLWSGSFQSLCGRVAASRRWRGGGARAFRRPSRSLRGPTVHRKKEFFFAAPSSKH